MQRAVNPQTGEVVFLVDNEWVKPAQIAKNPNTGDMAYLVGNQWQVVPGAKPAPTPPAATPGLGMTEPMFEAPVQDIEPTAPAAPRKTQTELTAYEPTLWQKIQGLIPGDRAKAANEVLARQVAKEKNISIDQAYQEIQSALGVRGIGGGETAGRPLFNPEGRPVIQAGVQAAEVLAKESKNIPQAAAQTLLRTIRAGEIDSAVDQNLIDKLISDLDIPKEPTDPNYDAFQGVGESLGYSLTTLLSSIVASGGTLATTGNPVLAATAGMGTSGTVAYRASKDEFLSRVRDKLNDASKKLYGTPISDDEWTKAKQEYEQAATEYGAWEAIPEAVSNLILGKVFFSPAKKVAKNKLKDLAEKAAALSGENLTETVTGLGQNSAELKAGLTNEELSVVDAFRQQFVQTMLLSGVIGGGAKGKELATKFYVEQVEPRVDPASALGRAIKADVEAVGFDPEAIRKEAVARLSPDRAQLVATKTKPTVQVPLVKPGEVSPEPPEEIDTTGKVIDITQRLEDKTEADLAAGILEDETQRGRQALTQEINNEIQDTLNLAKQAIVDDPKSAGFFEQDKEAAEQFVSAVNQIYEGLEKGTLPYAVESVERLRQEANNLKTMLEQRIADRVAFEQRPRGEEKFELEETPRLVTESGVPTEEAFAAEPGATTLAKEPPTKVDQKEVNQFRQEQQRIESNLEEPKKVEGAVSGMPIVAVRVDSLKLSDDVPQFKSETEPLEGTFDTTGVGPIQVWERLNGDLEVISGRHRFDLAQRSGTPAIYAQIHREADGFSAQQASTLDALLNIRDNQGKTKDYVTFFKLSGIPEEEAKLQGFLGRSLGKRSFAISSKGSDALITAHRNDLISDEQAFTIAQNAPGNEGLQAVGIRAAQEGATLPRIANIMEAAKADPSGMPDATQDLFGFDDSYFKRLEQMSRIATQKQKDLEARISAISGASRKPELARAEGIDVKDPEAVKKRVGELKQQLAAWKSWSSNPELRSEIDAELAGKEMGFESVTPRKEAAPAEGFELTAETAEETVARQEREAKEKVERDQQTIADRERDLFKLETQAAERGEMATPDMFGGRDLANQPAPKPVKLTKQESDTLDLFGDDSMFNSLWTYSGETPAFTNTVQRLLKMLESGRITEEQFAERVGIELAESRKASREKREEAALRPKVRGELRIRAVLLEAARKGFISEDAARLAEWFISQNPALVEDLGISLRKSEAGVGGRYLPVSRIAVLMKMNEDRGTTVHEILHHLERMMPEKIRKAIQKSWLKSLGKAYQKAMDGDDANLKHFYQLLTDFHSTGNVKLFKEATEMIKEGEVGIEHYQHVNPSEFWAVNATRILEGRFDVRGDRLGALKKWLSEMFQYLKSVFGLQSDAPIMKALRSLAKSDGEFVTSHMLSKGAEFQSLSPEEQLLEKHKRPNTPITEPQGAKGFAINAANESKRIFKETVNSPMAAAGRFFGGLDRGLTKARNEYTWFGTGLNLADQARYGGQVKTTQGMASASLALNNALYSGNIAVQVIMRGKLVYDKAFQMYVSAKGKYSMANIYAEERKLRKKLGKQVGQDVINSYLEAKRSRSIENEYLDRLNEYETAEQDVQDAQDNLNNLIKNKAAPANIDAARTLLAKLQDEARSLKDELDNIEVARQKVTMTEEAIDEFIALEKVHPELRAIMDNWSSINKNLLDVYHQVGLMSDKRYDVLKKIQDYVPWQRVRLPDEDIHDPIQATTRSLSNIGREKLFKKGTPKMDVEFVATQGQTTFDVDPDMVIEVTINNKKVASNLLSVTQDGKVKIAAAVPTGAIVRFRGVRPVDNIVTNMTNNVVTMTINAIRQQGANRIVEQYAERDAKGKIKRYPKEDRARGVFKYIYKGRPIFVRIEDPLVAQAAIGMENMIIGVDNIMSSLANISRRSITISGFFQIKQVFKDAPSAAFVMGVKDPTRFILSAWAGFFKALRAKDPVIDLLKSAGIGGYYSPTRTPENEVKLRIGMINKSVYSYVIRALDAIGDASDMAQRYAVYKQYLKEGKDPAQAVFAAANVINFYKHGANAKAQAAVRLVPFQGVFINATEVLAQSFTGGGLRGDKRTAMIGKTMKVGGLLATYTVLYALLLAGDDDYWELDDATRLRNFIVPFSKKMTGEMIMTPMNTGPAFLFKALPEMIAINLIKNFSKDPMDVRRVRNALSDAAADMLLGPELAPPGIKQAMEITLDRSFFTERSITPKRLENVEAAEQYTAATSELGKFISALTSVPGTDKRVLNPMESDHVVKGIFGTVGATVMWASNLIAGPERPAMTTKEIPGIGGFVAPEVARGKEDLFYDLKDKTDKAYATFMVKVNRMKQDEQEEYLQKNQDLIAVHEYTNAADQVLKDINAAINRYSEGDPKELGMTPKERRDEITRLQKTRAEVLADVEYYRAMAFGTKMFGKEDEALKQ